MKIVWPKSMLDFFNGFAASQDLFADSCQLNLAVILPCSVAESLSPVRQGSPRNREELALQRSGVHVASGPGWVEEEIWWEKLAKPGACICVLAQGGVRALLPAAGTEGAQFASVAGSCTTSTVGCPCLPWPSLQANEEFISEHL